MRKELIEAVKLHALGNIEKHKMNIEVYLANPVGIGEHPDIMAAIEQELAKAAEFDEKLKLLEEICREHG